MKRDAHATRQRILTEATAEFAQHGIAGARVDRIAASAGCNKAMLYAYFESKDRLFDAVFDAVVVRNVSDVPIDAEDLPEYAARLSEQYERYPEVARLATWDRLERKGAGLRSAAIVEANAHKIREVAKAQEQGLIGDHLPAAMLLELVFAIAAAQFDAVAPNDEPPGRDLRRQAIREAVSRLVRP